MEQGFDLSKSKWLEQEVEVGGRQWRLNKLPPIIAKDVLVEHVRPIFATLDGVDLSSNAAIAVMFGKIPSVHLKALSKIFADRCIKTRNDAGQWVSLSTDVENFTQNLDPMDLMMLDLRCLAINFGRSVSAFVRNMADLAGADPQSFQDALTPSSMPE